jgi:hypothetical protein
MMGRISRPNFVRENFGVELLSSGSINSGACLRHLYCARSDVGPLPAAGWVEVRAGCARLSGAVD